jgi:hypothetical protein
MNFFFLLIIEIYVIIDHKEQLKIIKMYLKALNNV